MRTAAMLPCVQIAQVACTQPTMGCAMFDLLSPGAMADMLLQLRTVVICYVFPGCLLKLHVAAPAGGRVCSFLAESCCQWQRFFYSTGLYHRTGCQDKMAVWVAFGRVVVVVVVAFRISGHHCSGSSLSVCCVLVLTWTCRCCSSMSKQVLPGGCLSGGGCNSRGGGGLRAHCMLQLCSKKTSTNHGQTAGLMLPQQACLCTHMLVLCGVNDFDC